MTQRSKVYRAAAEQIDADRLYSPLEAADLAKNTSSKKMDATVEVALRLGVDPRKADQMVRGTVNLPHGTGKTARVIVFATGDKAAEAEAAGADGTDEEAGVPVAVAVLVQPPSASTAATKTAIAVSVNVPEPRRPAEISMRASMPAAPPGLTTIVITRYPVRWPSRRCGSPANARRQVV